MDHPMENTNPERTEHPMRIERAQIYGRTYLADADQTRLMIVDNDHVSEVVEALRLFGGLDIAEARRVGEEHYIDDPVIGPIYRYYLDRINRLLREYGSTATAQDDHYLRAAFQGNFQPSEVAGLLRQMLD